MFHFATSNTWMVISWLSYRTLDFQNEQGYIYIDRSRMRSRGSGNLKIMLVEIITSLFMLTARIHKFQPRTAKQYWNCIVPSFGNKFVLQFYFS